MQGGWPSIKDWTACTHASRNDQGAHLTKKLWDIVKGGSRDVLGRPSKTWHSPKLSHRGRLAFCARWHPWDGLIDAVEGARGAAEMAGRVVLPNHLLSRTVNLSQEQDATPMK